MSAAFEFVRYSIVNINYYADENNKSEKESKIETQIEIARNNESPSIFRLALTIIVTGPKTINLLMHGYFKWNGKYVADDTERCLGSFGTSILYPYARVAISEISILDGGKPIILPTINAFNMFDEDDEKSGNPEIMQQN
ncbi:MAG: protein-export chaperone SecB [Bacillota bacterium]|nr:protein-export chaperone SecB [Bacillota bacterium]